MLQTFYWDVPQDPPWWTVLASSADDFAASGITSVWLPPPSKGGAGQNDVGYGVYDRYDLGDYDQKGATRTRYGTRAELEAAIAALHAKHIEVYADVVMNHMMGGDGTETVTVGGKATKVWSRFSPKSGHAWDQNKFNGCEQNGFRQWHAWDFDPYYDGDAWDNLLGCEIRYADPSVRQELIEWGKWLTQTLSLDGYRLDATKHMLTDFVVEWLDQVKGDRFAVSEAWLGNLDHLKDYAQRTQGKTRLFDVPLHYLFSDMSAQNGGFDMRRLKNAGLVAARPELSVTFVDNHDTVKSGGLYSPVDRFKLLAYAYILLREGGVPSIFYSDFIAEHDALKKLTALRSSHARGKGSEHAETSQNIYVYSRHGDDDRSGLVLLLNDGATDMSVDVVTPFPNVTLHEEIKGGTATTDATGKARLSVPASDYTVWVR